MSPMAPFCRAAAHGAEESDRSVASRNAETFEPVTLRPPALTLRALGALRPPPPQRGVSRKPAHKPTYAVQQKPPLGSTRRRGRAAAARDGEEGWVNAACHRISRSR